MYSNFHEDYKVLPVFEIISNKVMKNTEKVQNDPNNETKSSESLIANNETKPSENFEKSLINKLLEKNDEIKVL